MNNKKKIIIFALIILFSILIILVGGFYYFYKKPINLEKPLYENSLNKESCESKFTFSEDKIKWAQKNGRLNLLNEYFYCQAGLKNDYQICDLYFSFEGETKICYKIVGFKNVFLSLAKEQKMSQQIISKFHSYLNDYLPSGSAFKKFILPKESNFLEAYLKKDISVCEGVEGKEDCQSFVSKDEKYCQNLADKEKKERCVMGAMLMQAIDAQDIGRCEKIKDKDNILPMVCRFILNQDENLCTSEMYLKKFINEYCSLGFFKQ